MTQENEYLKTPYEVKRCPYPVMSPEIGMCRTCSLYRKEDEPKHYKKSLWAKILAFFHKENTGSEKQ